MKVRTLLSAALAAGSMFALSACDETREVAGPLSDFNDFNLLVEVTETGPGADPNGYVITVSPGDVSERLAHGELYRLRVPKSDSTYTVTLSEVAGNCTADAMSRSIRVLVRDRWTLARRADFTVDCR
ncbi:MAG: hypothetical protein R3195_04175 [Gemmatimonadota bacterium]|nr:hypothetical protein [Gemmatimonadota bacterium]